MINKCDLNVDKNNRDYGFYHNKVNILYCPAWREEESRGVTPII